MSQEHRNGADAATDIRLQKANWRSQAASIPPTSPEESERITAILHEVMRRHDWVVVLTFLAMPGEVDLGGLRNVPDLTLAVTRTPPKGPLTIHALEEPLELHPFGYLQPRPDASSIDPSTIDVVLVPGLIFDRNGGRLGHGKGYYDRLLSSLDARPYLIGVTVDRRVVDRLPMTDDDIWMDAVATETGFREALSAT